MIFVLWTKFVKVFSYCFLSNITSWKHYFIMILLICQIGIFRPCFLLFTSFIVKKKVSVFLVLSPLRREVHEKADQHRSRFASLLLGHLLFSEDFWPTKRKFFIQKKYCKVELDKEYQNFKCVQFTKFSLGRFRRGINFTCRTL